MANIICRLRIGSVVSKPNSSKLSLIEYALFIIPTLVSDSSISPSIGMDSKFAIQTSIRKIQCALAGIMMLIRGKCATICKLLSRPHRYVIVPDSSKFVAKLPKTAALVKSPKPSPDDSNSLVPSPSGNILGTLISSLLLNGIPQNDSAEKKTPLLSTVASILSLFRPAEMQQGF